VLRQNPGQGRGTDLPSGKDKAQASSRLPFLEKVEKTRKSAEKFEGKRQKNPRFLPKPKPSHGCKILGKIKKNAIKREKITGNNLQEILSALRFFYQSIVLNQKMQDYLQTIKIYGKIRKKSVFLS